MSWNGQASCPDSHLQPQNSREEEPKALLENNNYDQI